MLDLFDRIGFPCKVSRNATGNHNYTVYSKQLWTYLDQFGGSRDKYVPAEILNLDAGLLERLWTGYVNGDSFGDARQFHLTSVSRRLMEDMQQVILRVFGRLPQIRTTQAQYKGEPYEYYGISFSWGDKVWNSRYGSPSEVEYHNDVFCLTLERNGTMLVRRNGVVSWSGNCFREYIGQLMEYDKKFVVMANKNAITYKEVWPHIQSGNLWVGATSLNGGRWMILPSDIEVESDKVKVDSDGNRILNVAGVCWFTNLDHHKRHEELITWKKYSPEEFPHYDNYDAIEVSQVKHIPADYDGVMGVPITFLDKWNPEQFEFLGASDNGAVPEDLKTPHFKRHNEPYVDGRKVYKRIFIRPIKSQPTEES